jgi:hypothetical protein
MYSRLKHRLLHTSAGNLLILTAAMSLLYLATAPVILCMQKQGLKMLGIAAAIAGVCYTAAALAMLGEKAFSGKHHATLGLYWAMMIRTGVPLIAALFIKLLGGSLVELPVIGCLLLFYFGALIVQVLLSYLETQESTMAKAQRPLN